MTMSKQSEKDLKYIVRNFKNDELRSLLSFAKRNNAGKKSILLERVNEMIEAGCTTSLMFKINDINSGKGSSKSLQKRWNLDGKAKSPEVAGKSASLLTKLDANKAPANDNGIVSATEDPNSTLQECPYVKFADLPFYEQMEVLVKPLSLRTSSHFGVSDSVQYRFQLSSQQADCITAGQELVNDCMIEYKVQILMRFCLNSQNQEQWDNLPSSLYVSVNGKAISLPILPSLNHASVDSKRSARPLDITHACNLTSEVPSMINMAWNHTLGPSHCFTVVISKKMNPADLLEKLKANSIRTPEHTKKLINEKLAADADNEISTTSLKISLICPLGRIRLTVPARSSDCSHLQCFDAETYLQMNEKKPTWICPICDKSSKFETLVIDGLFSEILSVVNDANEVQFFEDGSWKPVIYKKEVYCERDNSIVCLDIPDSPSSSSSADTIVLGDNRGKRIKTRNTVAKKQVTMIDLTADSDDDEGSVPNFDKETELRSTSVDTYIPTSVNDYSDSDIGGD